MNMESFSIEDAMFYDDLERQILLIMDEDDETHIMRDVKDVSRLQKKSVVSGSNCFSWSESGKSVEVPSWIERLWARNGSGTGVFIPRVVAPVKPRRRRNNKAKRNNSRG
ncbi:hypothetical protein Tco_0609089 [Tanacetum coccineum]